ncbi:MAG TPA: NADP-dependent oxidoreductase [Candidatus Saccharimonadales bacterium]|nr:NADP-dependent oxidoreductase [Candidatus Saccharimonadales bacterium]
MKIPVTMKAAVIDEYGGSDNFRIRSIPVPAPEANEILIQVSSAGIGSWEADEREGRYEGYFGTKTTFPYILGWDGAGTVVAAGSGVNRFKVGDQVYAASTPLPRGGFYAEYAVVDQQYASHIPNGLPVEQAGAMAWDGLTGLSGLKNLDLKPGETLMVFGASGGIGHIVVQLAKRMGVKVFAVASGDDGKELVKRLGADQVVDGRIEDIVAAARQFAPEGLDAALLTAGGKAADQALLALRRGARVGWPNGVMPQPNIPTGIQVFRFDGDRSQSAFEELNHLVDSGPFEVHIAHTFPLSQVSDSHDMLATHFVGKLALNVGN